MTGIGKGAGIPHRLVPLRDLQPFRGDPGGQILRTAIPGQTDIADRYRAAVGMYGAIRQMDGVDIGLQQMAADRRQPSRQRVARRRHGAAGHHCAARSPGARRIGRRRGIAMYHLDRLDSDAEHFMHDLCKCRFQALAVRLNPDPDLRAAIGREPQCRLFETGHHGDSPSRINRCAMRGLFAENGKTDTDALSVRRAGRLPRAHGGNVDCGHRPLETFGVIARVEMLHRHVLERHALGRGQIAQPEEMRLDIEGTGEIVQQDLKGETDAGPRDAPIGEDRRLVCRRRPAPIAGEIVGPRQDARDLRRFETGGERIGRIRAGIDRRLAFHRQQPAIGGGVRGDLVMMLAAIGIRGQLFAPVLDPAYRLAGLHRDPAQRHLFGEQDSLIAKTAADIGGNDPDLAFVQTEAFGKAGAHDMRHLGRRGQGQHLEPPVPFGNDTPPLDRGHRLARGTEGAGHRRSGLALQGLDIGAAFDKGFQKDIVAPGLVQQRCIGGPGLDHVEDDRQGIDLAFELCDKILRRGTAWRDTGGDQLAHIADLVMREDRLQRRLETGKTRIRPDRRDSLKVRRHINIAFPADGLGNRLDPAMRNRATQECDLTHAEPFYVRDEFTLAPEKARILLAPNRGANTV